MPSEYWRHGTHISGISRVFSGITSLFTMAHSLRLPDRGSSRAVKTKLLRIVAMLAVVASQRPIALAENASGDFAPKLQTFSNYSRILFPVHPQTAFKVSEQNSSPLRVLLSVDSPKGEPWGKPALRDAHVSSIEIRRDEGSVKEALINLSSDKYEYFAYYQPEPAAIVVDIWPKANDAQDSSEKNIKPEKRARTPANEPAKNEKVADRIPPLTLNGNLFYEFPAVIPPFTFSGKTFDTEKERDPGEGWDWTDPQLDLPGGINFSLAQKLFTRKQYALAIRSIEFARRDHPENIYIDEMAYLEALCYRQLANQENNNFLRARSEEKLKELMLKPNGKDGYLPFANKIRMYFASEAYRNERWLDAISHFEFITTMKESRSEPDYPGMVMATAKAYLALRQYRRAERIYRSIISENPNSIWAMEAMYRWGNLLANEGSFAKADEVLDKAQREFPQHEQVRVEAFYNQAEANFWLGNLKKSEALFHKFIERHPANTLAGLAWVRLGEIAELQGRKIEEAKQLYKQAISRFPFSEGDSLARIRLARLSLPTEVDLDFQIDTLQKISEHEKNPVVIRTMGEEVLLRYLLRAERFTDVIARTEERVKQEEGSKSGEIFRKIFFEGLLSRLSQLNKNQTYQQVLELYKAKESWFEKIGPEVYRELAKAYRGLNLLGASNQFMARYLEGLTEGRKPSSYAKDRDQAIELAARTEFLQGRYGSVVSTLDGAKDLESIRLRALSLAKLNRVDEARALAEAGLKRVTAEMNTADQKRDRYIIDFTEVIITWQESRKEFPALEESLRNSLALLSQQQERFSFLLGDALWYQLKHRGAVEAYAKAIELFPESGRLDRANYRMAMSHLALNEKNVAVNVLTKLAESSQNIWGKSAKQELDLIAWEQKYSVLLGDLPPSGLGIRK